MARTEKPPVDANSDLDARRNSIFLAWFVALLGALSLIASGFDLPAMLSGLGKIIVLPDILINDYVSRAGLGPALFNAFLCAFSAFALLAASKVVTSGPAVAAVLTIAGFALFGKNVFNIWPGIVGVFLYSRVGKKPFSGNILVALFGTALSPLTSEIAFGMGISQPWNFVVACLAGIAAGFFLSPLAKHVLDFHRGYNLYNIGFTAGLAGTLIFSIMKAFGIELSDSWEWARLGPWPMLPVMAASFVAMAIAGMLADRSWRGAYRRLLWSSGRLVSDFTRAYGFGATLVNMGAMGLIACAWALLIGASWNGPVVGAILTVVGFSAFGKHPANALMPMIGASVTALLTNYGLDDPASQLAVLFSTTLAPVCGGFGPVAGLFAGALHFVLVQTVGVLHGGINLYNNGFAGGMTAGIMVPILDWMKNREER